MAVAGLSLPFTSRPTSGFGRRWLVLPGKDGFFNDHTGTDWGGPRGTPLPSLGAGRVYDKRFTKLKGNQIGIDHGTIGGHAWKSRWHMLDQPTPFEEGDQVRAGETVGGMGRSGSAATGVHGHGELLRDGVPVDMVAHLTYTGFLSLSRGRLSMGRSRAANRTVQEAEMYMIVSPGGQGVVVGNRYIDFGKPGNVTGTTGLPVMTTTMDMHQRIIGALSQQDNLPLIVGIAEGDGTIFQLVGGKLIPIADIRTVQQLEGLGASTITISKAELENWLKILG